MSRTVLPGGDENRRGSCLGCGAGRVRAAQYAAKPEGCRFIHMARSPQPSESYFLFLGKEMIPTSQSNDKKTGCCMESHSAELNK